MMINRSIKLTNTVLCACDFMRDFMKTTKQMPKLGNIHTCPFKAFRIN